MKNNKIEDISNLFNNIHASKSKQNCKAKKNGFKIKAHVTYNTLRIRFVAGELRPTAFLSPLYDPLYLTWSKTRCRRLRKECRWCVWGLSRHRNDTSCHPWRSCTAPCSVQRPLTALYDRWRRTGDKSGLHGRLWSISSLWTSAEISPLCCFLFGRS